MFLMFLIQSKTTLLRYLEVILMPNRSSDDDDFNNLMRGYRDILDNSFRVCICKDFKNPYYRISAKQWRWPRNYQQMIRRCKQKRECTYHKSAIKKKTGKKHGIMKGWNGVLNYMGKKTKLFKLNYFLQTWFSKKIIF